MFVMPGNIETLSKNWTLNPTKYTKCVTDIHGCFINCQKYLVWWKGIRLNPMIINSVSGMQNIYGDILQLRELTQYKCTSLYNHYFETPHVLKSHVSRTFLYAAIKRNEQLKCETWKIRRPRVITTPSPPPSVAPQIVILWCCQRWHSRHLDNTQASYTIKRQQ